MSPLQRADFGLDADRASTPVAPMTFMRRRLGGRYLIDPFGFDPQLADVSASVLRPIVRIELEGSEHLPVHGAATLVVNRGLGVVEPTAVALAVRRAVGRRTRVVGLPGLPFAHGLSRRLGAIAASPEDVAGALRARHLVMVPLAPTWLRTDAGTAPLAIVQAMVAHPVIPVAVAPCGPLGTPTRWRVRFGVPIQSDPTYESDDPLAAAELGEQIRHAVGELLGVSVA